MDHADAVIGILEEVVRIVDRPETDVAWSQYNNVQETVKDIKHHIARLQNDDFSRIEDLAMLFAPTGSLQEISISSGWGDEFLEIAARFDRAVAPLRQA